MKASRVERTLLYKNFGVFRYSDLLEKYAITTPSEQIVAIGHFIEEVIGRATQLPRLSDQEALEDWIHLALDKAITRWRKTPYPLERLDSLALRTNNVVAWNPYTDFSELLNARCGARAYALAASRLRTRGFGVGLLDLSGFTAQFMLFYLPRAVRSFDPRRSTGHEEAWLATVFYRFALGQYISDQKNRQHLDTLRPTGIAGETLEERREEHTRQGIVAALPVALERLPNRERLALELYFGFRDREYTLAEIATKLSVSEYLARTAIVRSLARLSASLGVQGPLDEQELALLNLLFGEGIALEQAARKLHITLKQAHTLSARITHKFRQGLRSRTTTPSRRSAMSSEETAMNNISVLSDEEEQILTELKQLQQAPSLRTTATGELLVSIASRWVPVTRIRKIIEHSGALPMLQELQIPLDWLAIPDATFERADLPEDAAAWAQALEELGHRAWVIAEVLYHHCCEEAESQHCLFVEEEKEQTVERLHRTLAGVAQSLEMELPLQMRRQGTVRVRIDRQKDDKVIGHWEGSVNEQGMDIRNLVEESAALLGEFSSEAIEVLVPVFVREIFADNITIPGFRRVQEATEHTIWLDWLPPTLHREHLRNSPAGQQ